MADGFVVLQSYVDSINLLPEERRWPFFMELFQYRVDGTEPKPQTDLERMALVNIFPIIDKSVERYTANRENGQRGGRPTKRKFIKPAEWQAYLKDHSQKETAEHFEISIRTLQRWIAVTEAKGDKTGQNQDIDIDKDIDTHKDIDIRQSILKINQQNASTQKTLKGVSAPRAGEPGFEWVKNGVRYRITEKREVLELGPEG